MNAGKYLRGEYQHVGSARITSRKPIKEKKHSCPQCSSQRLAVTEEQMFLLDTMDHWCHSIKAGDDEAKITCLDCHWSCLRKDLYKKMTDKTKLTFEDLKTLATFAKVNGTEHVYQKILLEWCQAAANKIEHLYLEESLRNETTAIKDVLAERLRQIHAEGFTPEQDQIYTDYELRDVALCYASENVDFWPWNSWDPKWWKPKDYRTNLVKAAALLLAEIERLDNKQND